MLFATKLKVFLGAIILVIYGLFIIINENMKLFFLSMMSIFIFTQEVRLEGKYRMEYVQEYSLHNCIINFKENAR